MGFLRAIPLTCLAAAACATACTAPLSAGGGPRNVLVVVNEASEESLEIGAYYLRERSIPEANFCRLSTSTSWSVSKAVYQDEIEQPILDCIAASPYADRIDYLVLTRGLPIRANFPDASSPPTSPVSIAALLQVMDTTLRGKDQEYGAPYGFQWHTNPYRGRNEWFSHSKTFGGYYLYVATMLSGFWSEDAKALVDRSMASDGNPPSAAGIFYLEDASGAANVRNADFPQAVANLQARGFDAVHVTGADPDVSGAVVASHVSGGSYSGISEAEIRSNEYPPGAVVDVLESFGLVPRNFEPDGSYSQVPVTWWLAAGATGGHGTVSEPYNVAFPDGYLLEPYVDGFNLAETFYQGIPYLYWMNLVVGDPLAAPWAEPPVVSVDAPADGATVSGLTRIDASASTSAPEGIALLELFVDDELVSSAPGPALSFDWDPATVADGRHRIEAVAYDGSVRRVQATAGIDVEVDDLGLVLAITDPPAGTTVAGQVPVTVEGSPAVVEVSLRSEGLDLGSAVGASPFLVQVDTALLGRGLHDLVAVGLDGGGDVVWSAPHPLRVEKAPRVWSPGGVPRITPAEGPQSGGTEVAFEGWSFEAGIGVRFDGIDSPSVTVDDANHLRALTPPHAPGVVDVRLVNPVGGETLLASAYTYLSTPCPVTASVSGVVASRPQGSALSLAWDVLADPCLASYQVWSFTDPDPLSPPTFPGDWTDATAEDQDGDPGGDPSFLHDPPAGLALYLVTGMGTDGSTGPR